MFIALAALLVLGAIGLAGCWAGNRVADSIEVTERMRESSFAEGKQAGFELGRKAAYPYLPGGAGGGVTISHHVAIARLEPQPPRLPAWVYDRLSNWHAGRIKFEDGRWVKMTAQGPVEVTEDEVRLALR